MCANIKVYKYIFKYIYKSSNRASLRIQRENNIDKNSVDLDLVNEI